MKNNSAQKKSNLQNNGASNSNAQNHDCIEDLDLFDKNQAEDLHGYGGKQVYAYKALNPARYDVPGYIASYIHHYIDSFGKLTITQKKLSALLGVSLRSVENVVKNLRPIEKEKFKERYGILVKSRGLYINTEVVRHFGISFAAIVSRLTYQEILGRSPLTGSNLAKEIGISLKQLEKIKAKHLRFFDENKSTYSVNYKEISDFIRSNKEAAEIETAKMRDQNRKNAGSKPQKCGSHIIVDKPSLKPNDRTAQKNERVKEGSLSPQIPPGHKNPKEALKGGKLAQNILALSNKIRGEDRRLTSGLSQYLNAAHARKLNSNMEKWEEYLEASKDLTLEEALDFYKMDKLLKEINDKKENVPLGEDKINQMIDDLDERKEYKQRRQNIIKKIGAAAYYSWFHQASFVDTGGEILLSAPNPFVQTKWEELFPEINKNRRIA